MTYSLVNRNNSRHVNNLEIIAAGNFSSNLINIDFHCESFKLALSVSITSCVGQE